MHNIGSYDDRLKNFDWKISEDELGYKPGDVINIGWYCSDRICQMGKGDKLALKWEGLGGKEKNYTYNDIRQLSNTIGVFLRKLGVQPEERVCLFLDRIPELYIGFIGILKTGAIAQPLFSAFGEESLHVRMESSSATAIITQKKHLGKVRKIVADLPHLRYVIVVDDNAKSPLQDKEVAFNMDEADRVDSFEVYPTLAESPSVLHYTSGTTGMPKGVKHVHYSLISQYLTTKWVLDLKDDDIYWCTADPGWVTGTSYGIIGAWASGVTQCVNDIGFSAEAWYKFIEKHRISVWYSAPTAIRSLMKAGDEIIKQFDLSCLRHLASVGEPLNAEAVIWAEKVFGLPFHDSYWQTETGSIMISNYPGMKIKAGSMGKPFPGITATILNADTYEEVPIGKAGLIGFKPGWPAMMRTYWNNEEIYKAKFKNGWYIPGDRSYIDADGYYWFIGRDDDIINTGGHLVSPFEVESALIEHPSVAESAVVSKPDFVNMEVVKAFVCLKPGYIADDELELQIMNFIRKKLSPLAMPQEIEFVPNLPKTRSGKIMRRILKAQEWGEEVGDTSSLEDD